MIYGVVGNRKGFTYAVVKAALDRYVDVTEIVSGGAEGVDTHAQRYAKEKGLKLTIYYPYPGLSIPQRYFERNKKIAEHCDILIAFNKKTRSGTAHTMQAARELGKPVTEIGGKE